MHRVVAAAVEPEQVMRTVKAWATRALVEKGHVARSSKVWGRHGSTVYLWTRESVDRARWYVREQQDERAEWR